MRFGRVMNRFERIKYKAILNNILACTTYQQAVACKEWLDVTTDLHPIARSRLNGWVMGAMFGMVFRDAESLKGDIDETDKTSYFKVNSPLKRNRGFVYTLRCGPKGTEGWCRRSNDPTDFQSPPSDRMDKEKQKKYSVAGYCMQPAQDAPEEHRQ